MFFRRNLFYFILFAFFASASLFVAAADSLEWKDAVSFRLPIAGHAWKAQKSATTVTLAGVAVRAVNDVWAVGAGGTILHGDGATWTNATSPTTNNLWAVTMLSATDGWAVGDSGTIVHWDGTAWTAATSPTKQHLLAVRAVNANDVWIVGEGGTILRWNGTAWTTAASPTTVILYSVAFASATDGWAVGDLGTILRWNGTAWTAVASPTTIALSDSIAFDATHAFAVGDEGIILRWDGTAWESATGEGSDTLLSIAMTSSISGWIVGDNGTILETTDGEQWTAAKSPVTEAFLRVKLGANDTGWVVGTNGTILSLQPTYAASGVFTSSVKDAGTRATLTGLRWSSTTPAGTAVAIQLASNTDNATWNFVGPDGTAKTFYTNAAENTIVSARAGDQYLRYRATLSTSDPSITPTLQEVTLAYTPIPTPPAAPTLATPVDMNTLHETPITFVWTKSTDATSYELQVDTTNNFTRPLIDAKKIDARITTPVATWKDGAYFWRVRAVNAQGVSAWTPPATFTIALPPVTPPPAPPPEEVPQPTPTPPKTVTIPTEPVTITPAPQLPLPSSSPSLAPTVEAPPLAPSSVTPSAGTGGGGNVEFPITVTSPLLMATDRPSFRGTMPLFNTVAGVVIDGQLVTTTTLDAQGFFSLDLPIRLPDGDHTLQLVVQGIASLPVIFTIDTHAPPSPATTITVVRQESSGTAGFIASVLLIAGTVSPETVAVEIIDGTTQALLARVAPEHGAFAFLVTPLPSPVGTYPLVVYARDAAGNVSSGETRLTYMRTGATIIHACSDSADNDGDGKMDYPLDPGCAGYTDDDENDTLFLSFTEQPAVKAVTDAVTNTAAATVIVTKKIVAKTVEQTIIVAEQTQRVVVATAPVVVPTLTVVAPVAVAVNPATAANLPMIPKMVGHAFAWLFSALGIKKKRRNPWGIVYDAITKDPIGLAIVRLFDAGTERLLATQVTDKEGRFEFLPTPGAYTLAVVKTPYTFPSHLVTGSEDNEHLDIYHGETVTITSAEQALQVNIPLDPEDPRRAAGARTIATWMRGIRRIVAVASLPLLIAGTAVSIIFYAFAATRYNFGILLVYIAIAAYQIILSPKAKKSWGTIFDAVTLAPVPLALVHIIDPKYQRVLKSRLSDYHGRFTFLPDPGIYQLRVVKQGYRFPAATIPTHAKYKHPYRGEALTISKNQPIVAADIPLDPVQSVSPRM